MCCTPAATSRTTRRATSSGSPFGGTNSCFTARWPCLRRRRRRGAGGKALPPDAAAVPSEATAFAAFTFASSSLRKFSMCSWSSTPFASSMTRCTVSCSSNTWRGSHHDDCELATTHKLNFETRQHAKQPLHLDQCHQVGMWTVTAQPLHAGDFAAQNFLQPLVALARFRKRLDGNVHTRCQVYRFVHLPKATTAKRFPHLILRQRRLLWALRGDLSRQLGWQKDTVQQANTKHGHHNQLHKHMRFDTAKQRQQNTQHDATWSAVATTGGGGEREHVRRAGDQLWSGAPQATCLPPRHSSRERLGRGELGQEEPD